MENIKIITSFTSHTTQEGRRISYTISEVDSNGNLIVNNEKATCVVVDSNILQKIDDINKFLLDRESAAV